MTSPTKDSTANPPFGTEAKRFAQRPSLRTLAIFYWARVRAQPTRELLALVGIAAGVALLFAVQVGSKSVTGSFEQLSHGILGRATLEVAARGREGFDQSLLRRIDRLPAVDGAAPMLERRVAIVGPQGRSSLTLFGVDRRLRAIGGQLVTKVTSHDRDLSSIGLQLPGPAAGSVGAVAGDSVAVHAGERSVEVPVAGVYGAREVGSLAQSPVALAPLGQAQEIAGMPGRVSRVLVAPLPGRKREASTALTRLAADRLDVRSSDTESRLLADAFATDKRTNGLWSVLGLVVGILLAYNAMLLTVLERRAIVTTLRMLGAGRRAIAASVLFDAVTLGVAASLVGVVLGDQLTRHVITEVPRFLTVVFPIGDQRVVEPEAILASIAGGTLAAVAAAAGPALTLLRAGPLETVYTEEATASAGRKTSTHARLFLAGAVLLAAAIVGPALLPSRAVLAAGPMVVGLVMVLPAIVTYVLRFAQRLNRRLGSAVAHVSLSELTANSTRAAALAATGAVAAMAVVTLSGAVGNLRQGLLQTAGDYLENADLWVTVSTPLEESEPLSLPFAHRRVARRLERLPEVQTVRSYSGGPQDVGGKWRLWRLAVSPRDRTLISSDDTILDGDLRTATRRLRTGGWVALSAHVAKRLKLEIGEPLALPTPTGTRQFRIAATISNIGWPPVALVINGRDFARAWGTPQASALEIDLAPGVPPEKARSAVQRVVGNYPPLRVETSTERKADLSASLSQATARTEQLSDMVLVTAVLAVVSAMLAAVWQRRRRLSALRVLGMSSGQLFRALFLETGVILLIGCSVGAAVGLAGQALADRWSEVVQSYSVPFTPAWGLALRTVAVATLLAVVATLVPALLSLRRFSAQLALSPE